MISASGSTKKPEAAADATPQAEWYMRSVGGALAELGVSADQGLAEDEAAQRLQQVGPNELVEKDAKSPLRIFLDQLSSVMVIILLVAALLSLVLGKYLEAGTILAIVVLFAVLGFFQEYRAERAIAALRKLSVPNVRVRRSGAVRELPGTGSRAGRYRPARGRQHDSRRPADRRERQLAHPRGGPDRRV